MTIRIEGQRIRVAERLIGIRCDTCEDNSQYPREFKENSPYRDLESAKKVAQQHEWRMNANALSMRMAPEDHQIIIKIYHKDRPPRLPF